MITKPQLRFRGDWRRVAWGAPDSPQRELCAYCHCKLDDDSVPLSIWKPDGSMAQFCDECVEKYWGAS